MTAMGFLDCHPEIEGIGTWIGRYCTQFSVWGEGRKKRAV